MEKIPINYLKTPEKEVISVLLEAMKKLSSKLQAKTEVGFIDEKGMVVMDKFSDLPNKDIAGHKKLVADSERFWSGVDDEITRKNFIENFGFVNETEESISKRIEERYHRMKKEGSKVEMLITILLHKGLGEDFTAVRASEYDDFHNGLDNIIVNRKTGEVIGAFDEIHNDELGKGALKKQEKILKKTKSWGAKVEYGFTYSNSKMVKKSLDNIPIFYIPLTSKDMNELIRDMDFNNLDQLNSKEKLYFDNIINKLSQQNDLLLQEKLISPLKNNLLKSRQIFNQFSSITDN